MMYETKTIPWAVVVHPLFCPCAFALKLFTDVCLRTFFRLELEMWLRGSRSLGFDPQQCINPLRWLMPAIPVPRRCNREVGSPRPSLRTYQDDAASDPHRPPCDLKKTPPTRPTTRSLQPHFTEGQAEAQKSQVSPEVSRLLGDRVLKSTSIRLCHFCGYPL